MPAGNELVTPQQFSHPSLANKSAQDRYQLDVQGLPCEVVAVIGELVRVKVEAQGKFTIPQILVPQGFSQWMREPTQVGDKGILSAANYYIGGMSGLGGGVANYQKRGNMTPLIFLPISQKQFPNNSSRNLNAAFINGPQGVVLQDTGGACKVTLTPSGVTTTIGTITVVVNATDVIVSIGSSQVADINASGITFTTPVVTIDGALVVTGGITG